MHLSCKSGSIRTKDYSDYELSYVHDSVLDYSDTQLCRPACNLTAGKDKTETDQT